MLQKMLKYIYFNILKLNKFCVKCNDISSKIKLSDTIQVMKHTFIDSNCEIGNYTYIGKNCNITKAKIGRYCSIANNVSIGQGEHITNRVSTSSLFYKNAYDELTQEKCIIGNDVWIGTDAIVLRGIEVGDGAIIGANAVVTKDVPSFSIVVGTPARVIRYRFNKEQIENIKESKWWEYNFKKAEQIIKALENG